MRPTVQQWVIAVGVSLFCANSALSQDVEWQLIDSDVGVGTGSPATKLHVVGEGGNVVEEVLRLQTRGAPQQVFLNSDTGATWLFAMAGDDSFKVSFAGTGKVEARFRQNGNMIIAGALTENSDRNSKDNIREIDGADVLQKVVNLPISTWEYKVDRGVTHLGPMAQDFYAAFGLGQSPTGISTIDTGGVALAAIQGLHAQLRLKASRIESLESENRMLKASLQQHEERMVSLEMGLTDLLNKEVNRAQLSYLN
jgi:hypothetical protein